jgi:hypothetical protein
MLYLDIATYSQACPRTDTEDDSGTYAYSITYVPVCTARRNQVNAAIYREMPANMCTNGVKAQPQP